MGLFEKHPLNVRKKIALGGTVTVAVILVVIMVLHYKAQEPSGNKESTSQLTNFYNTILRTGQSIFYRK